MQIYRGTWIIDGERNGFYSFFRAINSRGKANHINEFCVKNKTKSS